ncbi:iron-containing alcohol dehydrogenase [Serratia sp. DD3]|uniref:iron-containing alcohol dehydrogenase n=1 Tax=Serratia sp. DD3 TaxID=1410619 RepID=UPI0003C51C75|nr:iron-containing alcohol dehydrogenase [Serratia sp. DD3]KEY58807.1 NAD-dependent methanol dehydrogenase [Serratia sp. DD3]
MSQEHTSAETLQTALYQALDRVNARQVKEFAVPPVTLMGAGAVARSGAALADRGIEQVFMMVDAHLHLAGVTQGILRSLQQAGVTYDVWSCPAGEPVERDVLAAVQQLRQSNSDSILAFGGGSVLDAAKAVAVLAANPALKLSALGPESRIAPRLPLIAIPTTAGTGSEATNIAVIISDTAHHKQVLLHSALLPDLAIIDANLTVGVPAQITAATGIDALTHAIEAYVACNATPLTRSLAYQAIHLIGEALPLAVGQGGNITAREAMMQASYMAGMAFSNAGLGVCHACAHQIGAAYGIAHGLANAIMLPAVMKFNRLVCKQTYAEIGYALTGRQGSDVDAIDAVEQLIDSVDLNVDLAALGGKALDFAGFAKAAMQDACIRTNPRTLTEQQIVTLYQNSLANPRQAAGSRG